MLVILMLTTLIAYQNPTRPESSRSEVSGLARGIEESIANSAVPHSSFNEATSLLDTITGSSIKSVSSTIRHRQRRRDIMREVTSMYVGKEILEERLRNLLPVFDFEDGPVAQTPESFRLASSILGMNDTVLKKDWLDMDEVNQKDVIMFLARHTLRQVLRSYG